MPSSVTIRLWPWTPVRETCGIRGSPLRQQRVRVNYVIDFDDGPADVVLTTTGEASAERFDEMIRELVAHARFRPGLVILVDHTRLNLNALSNDDVRQVAETTRSVADALQAAFLVIVTPTVIGFGLSRMWQGLVDDLGLEAAVTMSRQEAEDRIRARLGD